MRAPVPAARLLAWLPAGGHVDHSHVVVRLWLRLPHACSHRTHRGHPWSLDPGSPGLRNARSLLSTEQLQLLNEPWTKYLSAEQHKLTRQDASGAAVVTIWGKVRERKAYPPPPRGAAAMRGETPALGEG